MGDLQGGATAVRKVWLTVATLIIMQVPKNESSLTQKVPTGNPQSPAGSRVFSGQTTC